MAFQKLWYYLYTARITIKCDYALLHKFLTVHTLNSKVKKWETEIASMCYMAFEHIKETANILVYHISWLKYIEFHEVLDPEEGREYEHIIFDELAPISTK